MCAGNGEEGGCKCVQVIVAMQTRCYKADLGKRCKSIRKVWGGGT